MVVDEVDCRRMSPCMKYDHNSGPVACVWNRERLVHLSVMKIICYRISNGPVALSLYIQLPHLHTTKITKALKQNMIRTRTTLERGAGTSLASPFPRQV